MIVVINTKNFRYNIYYAYLNNILMNCDKILDFENKFNNL